MPLFLVCVAVIRVDLVREQVEEGGAVANWTLAPTGDGPKPPKRDHTSLTFDPTAQALFVFGGRTAERFSNKHVDLNDLWRYDLTQASKGWEKLEPSGGKKVPSTRYMHVAAWSGTGPDSQVYPTILVLHAALIANL
jgi:hypothetical protein